MPEAHTAVGGIVDADNHYYEPDDAFTRHIDRRFADTAVHIRRGDDGVGRPFIGSDPLYRLDRTPLDRIAKPGSYRKDKNARYEQWPDERVAGPGELPHLATRDARIEWMDAEGIDCCLLWPSLGLSVENQLRDDTANCVANLRAFNRWIDEDWGFAGEGRTFGVPWLTLVDLEAGIAELEYVLQHGARSIALLFAPVNGHALGDPYFDPFWARVAEAGVPVGFHAAESGYNQMFSVAFGENPRASASETSAFQRAAFREKGVMDALASLVLHNAFGRHPNLKAMSIENGSEWVPYLLRVMDNGQRAGARGNWLGGRVEDRASDVFREHVWVAPDDDDDIRGLIDAIGVERVLLGSDYPHPEGHEAPTHFFDEAGLTSDEIFQISRSNGQQVLGLTRV